MTFPVGNPGPRPRVAGLLALLLVAAPGAGPLALSSDRDQPVEVVADTAELDDAQRTNTYQGNVVATQGTLRITGERLILYYDEGRRITRGEVFGEPATYEQLMDGESAPVRARARRMEYLVDDGVIELYEDGVVVQGGDTLSGDRVTYDTVGGNVRAVATGEGQERVRVTITPRKGAASSGGQGQ